MKLSLGSILPGPDRGWKAVYPVCGLASCSNKSTTRSIRNRAGITVDRVWYCGADCFAVAARNSFRALLSANVVEMPHVPRRSIGLVMLSKGTITSEQLQFAYEQSHMRGEDLEAALVRLGFANERQLAAARAAQWGCPVLGQDGIGQAVEADIPPTLLEAYSAVPIHTSVAAKRMVLGFVYRVEHSLLNSLEQITGLRGDPCFITPAERAEQMRRLTHDSNCEEIVFDDPYTPAAMANNVAGFALEVSAGEARFASCRNFVWARLTGKRQRLDVLFRTGKGKQLARQEDLRLPQQRLRAIG
jgi:uncharacterized protein (UPF0297 family)